MDTKGPPVPVHNPDVSWSGAFLLTMGLSLLPAAPALAGALAAARLAAVAVADHLSDKPGRLVSEGVGPAVSPTNPLPRNNFSISPKMDFRKSSNLRFSDSFLHGVLSYDWELKAKKGLPPFPLPLPPRAGPRRGLESGPPCKSSKCLNPKVAPLGLLGNLQRQCLQNSGLLVPAEWHRALPVLTMGHWEFVQ